MKLRDHSPVRSLRTRLALVGVGVLVAGLSLGTLAFSSLFEKQLLDDLDSSLERLATERARGVEAGLDPALQIDPGGRDAAIAVFDTDGTLLANRGFVSPSEVLDDAGAVPSTLRVDYVEPDDDDDDLEDGDLRVVVVSQGDTTVLVAARLEVVEGSVDDARALLFLAVPLITVLGGALLWVVIGRALRPVERMRRDAQAVAELGGEQRVHDPGSRDELGRLASTLNDMLDRLDANASAMRRFVSDASHEIRSPITNIRARIETAHPDDAAATRADVIGEVERIETIIDDLTYLARRDEGRLERANERVELDEILFAEASRLQRNGTVVVDAADVEPVVISGDGAHIRRAVRNLVDNAERHADGAVRLAVTSSASEVVVDVDDDGPGIPSGDRQRVFARFVRLDESRQRGSGGTGLGLAIVAEIAASHGGTVEVADAPLGGARLRLRLPVS